MRLRLTDASPTPDDDHIKEGAGGSKTEIMSPIQSPGSSRQSAVPYDRRLSSLPQAQKATSRNSTLPGSPQALLSPPLPSASCTSHSYLPSMDSSPPLPGVLPDFRLDPCGRCARTLKPQARGRARHGPLSRAFLGAPAPPLDPLPSPTLINCNFVRRVTCWLINT